MPGGPRSAERLFGARRVNGTPHAVGRDLDHVDLVGRPLARLRALDAQHRHPPAVFDDGTPTMADRWPARIRSRSASGSRVSVATSLTTTVSPRRAASGIVVPNIEIGPRVTNGGTSVVYARAMMNSSPSISV
jgi:hypothetical protein